MTTVIQRPKHPYTQLLISAAPDPIARRRRRFQARGDIPSLITPPSGCRFHPRCPHAMPVCRERFPGRTNLGNGHWTHCFLYGEGNDDIAPAPPPTSHRHNHALRLGVIIPMARIKLAYIGGGSTRAPGTMASFIWQGAQFNGSEVALIDLDAERLASSQTLARKMARARGLDLTITTTTNRRDGLRDCDAVLDQLPARRIRGALSRREHPAQAWRHRAGDTGAGRLLHGAALDPRHAGHHRRYGGGLPAARACSTTRIQSTSSPRR